MTSAAAQQSPDWMPRVLALISSKAGATADEQQEICVVIGDRYGPHAKAKAEDLFAKEREKSALERNAIKLPPISRPAPVPKPTVASAEPLPATPPSSQLPARSTADQYLEEMNGHHAIIDDVGGKTVIASWTPSVLDRSKLTLAYHKKNDFLLQYSNRFVSITNADGETSRKPLAIWWLGHRDRRQYSSVVFEPAGPMEINGCLNLWRRWGVEPVAGDWGLIRQHIEEVLAKGNPIYAEYVIHWIAWAIQHPDRQAEVVLVFMGEKGAGKGTLGRVLQRIFGLHAYQASSSETLVGRFNAHLQDCVLLLADEAQWGDGSDYKKCLGRLQEMITEPVIDIEPKGIGRFQVRNCLHIVMLAEPGWVIPAGRFERRYAAMEVSKKRLRDKSYFTALHRQIAEGGAEAMFHDLRQMELGDWHPRDIPEELLRGEALQRQQIRSLPPMEQWYLGLLDAGTLPKAKAKNPNRAFTKDLLADGREKFPSLKYSLTDIAMKNFFDTDSGEGIGNVCEKKHTAIGNGWDFPPLSICRAKWESIYGPQRWTNPTDDWQVSEVEELAQGPKPVDLFYKPKPAPPAVNSAVASPRASVHPAIVAGKLVRRI